MSVLTSKKVIVTGAASGIGKAVAYAMAREGAEVAMIDLNAKGVNLVAEEFLKEKLSVIALACDVSNSDQVQSTINKVVPQLGQIDVLVNCAGISPEGRVTDISEADFRKVLDINLVAIFLTSKYSLPHLIHSRGIIINIVGTLAYKAIRSKAAYCASKAGALNLTQQMALDYGDYGVRINVVCPGMVNSPLNAGLTDEMRNLLVEFQPLQRLTQPEDIAAAVVFLASEAARRNHRHSPRGRCRAIGQPGFARGGGLLLDDIQQVIGIR